MTKPIEQVRMELFPYFQRYIAPGQLADVREIGDGYAAGHEGEADYHCTFYAIDLRDGSSVRAATGNGDPMWEEEDQAAFAILAEECGVEV